MSLSTQPYKGTRDFYPEDKRIQKYMFGVMRRVVESFGYEEYDAPILESFDVYAAKTGEEIVNEQLYSFEDRGGRKVAIRPEMTPSASRMVAAKRQELAYPLRWYSIPNLMRYERPQRGRLREHRQLNVDIFGVEGVEAELEVITLADTLMKEFGAKPDMYEIRVNSRNFIKHRSSLAGPKDSELTPNEVLRVLDTWNKDESGARNKIEAMFSKPEVIFGMMSETEDTNESIFVDELKEVMQQLKKLGISSVKYDATIVRGFDYYTDIVFEVFDTNPENNRSIFGGGRYDGLVELFGAEPLSAVGFGVGDVTLQNFLETHKLLPDLKPETDLYVVLIGEVYDAAQPILKELRENGVNVALDVIVRKTEKQIKSADKMGIAHVMFIGERELEDDKFSIKNLETGKEEKRGIQQITDMLKDYGRK